MSVCQIEKQWIGMAIINVQLDYISNELQSRNGGHTSDPGLEAGKQRILIQNHKVGGHRF